MGRGRMMYHRGSVYSSWPVMLAVVVVTAYVYVSRRRMHVVRLSFGEEPTGNNREFVRRKRWAIAVMLSTSPSTKADGWKPRSVKTFDNSTDACPGSRSLCAVLVLRHSVERNGEVSDDADFVALIDERAPESLANALSENGARPVRMVFDEYPVFQEYLLLRKLYIFSLTDYERVLLLDVDGVVTGSLRFLLASPMRCGEDPAPPDAGGRPCRAVDPQTCHPPGARAEVLAQQTSGTPVLTAYMMARPDSEVWRALAKDLDANCGGDRVCDRNRVAKRGWGTSPGFDAPHDWTTRAVADRRRNSWVEMGAGFSDQGFVEYFFALKRRKALLVSKWSCAKRLHYLHFNVPPKPWNCPGPACRLDPRAKNGAKQATSWDSPAETRRWGGHHCARDWWWQYAVARPSIRRGRPGSCVARCATDLDLAMRRRADPPYRNYTPGARCVHLWDLA